MSTREKRRVVIYGRVSQDRRKQGTSVDGQISQSTAWATREGRDIVGVYRDDEISASRYARNKTRPGWQTVMEVITSGGTDELAAWEISRTTRDRAVWAALMAACQEQSVWIATAGRLHDPTDPDDGFMLDLSAALAVRESAMTSKRVNRDMRKRAGQGLPHGRIPYGYRREYDPTTGALLRQVADGETAPIIGEAVDRALRGEALYAIAADLNARGVTTPTGRPWEITRLRQILLNPTYAGLRVFQGQVIGDAAWPAIIDPDVHARLTAKITDPRRSTWVDGAVKHLLTGIAICGVCDSPCRLIKNRGTPSYACSKHVCVVRAEWLVDTVVEDAVVERLSRPDAHDLLARDNTADVQAARDEVAALRARLESFYDQAADGDLSAAALSRIEAKLMPQIDAADKRAKTVGMSPLVAELIGDEAGQRWDALLIPQKREVVRALLTPVIYKTVGGRRRDFKSVKPRWHGDPSSAPQRSGNNP